MKTDEGWAFELLRMFLEHCTPGFDRRTADTLGAAFYAGLMERPDIVEELRKSWLYEPVAGTPEDTGRKGTLDHPNPEVIVRPRYTIRIYRPV